MDDKLKTAISYLGPNCWDQVPAVSEAVMIPGKLTKEPCWNYWVRKGSLWGSDVTPRICEDISA